jgi:hypothetical protein
MKIPVDWLLTGPAWIRDRTRIDLLGEKETARAVAADRTEMLRDPQVRGLIQSLAQWPGAPIKNHKQASLLPYQLSFLAEIGVRRDDPGMRGLLRNILRRSSKDGIPVSPILVPKAFGGSGKVEPAWMLCDAPVILQALVRMGCGGDPAVWKGIAVLSELVRENGWPCAAAPALGKFRGPGSKADACPLANLLMLKLLAEDPALRKSPAARKGVDGALALWTARKTHKAYLFGMGTDFQKIKTPLIWYDLLHVTDVLSKYPQARKDQRFQQMIRLLGAKADQEGRFTSESVWLAWKDWEFGQKKQPSRWVTLLAQGILRRAEA